MSSSEEDHDLSKLTEAADRQFINDRIFKSKQQTAPIENQNNVTKLPSLRQQNESNLIPQIKPEFQKYVSKQLTQILENELNQTLTTKPTECVTKHTRQLKKRKRTNSGIKLFNDSVDFVEIPNYNQVQSTTRTKRKRNQNYNAAADDDVEENYEKCRSIAVNPDDILSRKETKYWSNRSKAPVYHYRRTPRGLLVEIKPEFK